MKKDFNCNYTLSRRTYKKLTLFSLLFLILITICLRYPFVDHERASNDSYINHAMANQITQNNYAPWIVNILSYFGFYPYSYPSGNAYIVAQVSTLLNLNIEESILFLDYVISIMGILILWVIGWTLTKNHLFSFLVSFIFSTMPYLLDLTYWLGSSRSIYSLFIPLTLFSLIQSFNFRNTNKSKNYYGLTILFIVILATLHRSFVLILLLSFIIIIGSFLINNYPYLFQQFKTKASFKVLLLLITLFFVQIIIIPLIYSRTKTGAFAEWGYYQGLTPIIGDIINLAISYTGKIGIFMFISFFGIFSITKNINKSVTMIIILFMVLIPFLNITTYISLITFPIFAILITLGFFSLFRFTNNKKGIIGPTIAIILILSTIFGPYMVSRWQYQQLGNTNNNWVIDNSIYSSGIYFKHSLYDGDIDTEGHYNVTISSIVAGKIPENNPLFKIKMVPRSFSFTWKPLHEILINPSDPYIINNENRINPNIKYFAEDINYQNKSTYYNFIGQSTMYEYIHNNKYLIYNDGIILVWKINPNDVKHF